MDFVERQNMKRPGSQRQMRFSFADLVGRDDAPRRPFHERRLRFDLLGQDLRSEPLRLGDALHLDGDRIDGMNEVRDLAGWRFLDRFRAQHHAQGSLARA